MIKISAKAPSRVDFAGGTLDLPFFARAEQGCTLNCAVSKYGHAWITPNNKNLKIKSLNYKSVIEIRDKKVVYDGKLDLIKAAIKRSDFFPKATLTTFHEMPPHSRLGSSSSISVAALGAINKFKKKPINNLGIIKLATKLEREELGLDNGPQDQYAAALGGINFIKFSKRSTRLVKVKLKDDFLHDLEKKLFLCYIGVSKKDSGDLNHEIVENYKRGDESTVNAIKSIKRVTNEMYKSLLNQDISSFSQLLTEEFNNRRLLNKGIVDSHVMKYVKIIKPFSDGFKILGAGGGGTLLVSVKDGMSKNLMNAVIKNKGMFFDFNIDFSGLKTWVE